MASKLYLIESEERDGLVKIGYTSTEVRERIERYREAISDPSTIHETPGNITFERYLHTFLSKYRKQIPITFKLSEEHLPGPREWFHLDSHVLAAILKAFDQEKHPISVEELEADDLPIFFSGVFSAIQWDAWFTNSERLEEIASREEFIASLDNFYRQQTSDDNWPLPFAGAPSPLHEGNEAVSTSYEAPPYSEPEPLQATTGSVLAKRAIDAIGQSAVLKVRLEQIQEMETGRTVIALIAIPCILFLMATGAWLAGNIFAIGVCLLLATWPHIQPHIAAKAVDLWRWLQMTANRSRERAENRHE